MTTKFSVVRPKKYQSGQEEKTAWLPVGTITKFDNGGMILEMNDRTEVYQIFPFKPKEERQQAERQEIQREIQVPDMAF